MEDVVKPFGRNPSGNQVIWMLALVKILDKEYMRLWMNFTLVNIFVKLYKIETYIFQFRLKMEPSSKLERIIIVEM